jgi:hypothetical protein
MDTPFEGMASLLMVAVRSSPDVFDWPERHRIMEVNKFLNYHALYECRYEPVELHKKGTWMESKGSLKGFRTDYYGHLAKIKRSPFLFERFKLLLENRCPYDYAFYMSNNAYNDLLYLAILENDLATVKLLLSEGHPIERKFMAEAYNKPSYLSAAVRSKNNEILALVVGAMKEKGLTPTETDNSNLFSELVRKPEGWESKWANHPAAILTLLESGYPVVWFYEGSTSPNWCFEQYFFDYHYSFEIIKTVLDYFLANKISVPQVLVERTLMLAILHRKSALINYLLHFPFRATKLHNNSYDVDWSDDEDSDGGRSSRRPSGKGGFYCNLPYQISVYKLASMFGVNSILDIIPLEDTAPEAVDSETE